MIHSEFKLNMNILLDELALYNPEAHIDEDPSLKLSQVRLFSPEITEFSENFLYITSDINIAVIQNSSKKLNIICLGHNDTIKTSVKNLNIITLNGAFTVNTLFSLFQDIFEKYKLWNQRMLDVILNGCTYESYQELLNISIEMLTNPIGLFDYSLTLLMHAGQLPEGFTESTWEDSLNLGYSKIDNYSIANKKKLLKDLSDKKEPFISKSDGYIQLFENIFIDDTLVGCLNLIELNSPITTGQISIVNHIKNLIEAIINKIKESYIYPNHNTIIDKMLKGHYVERKMIEHNLEKNNIKKYDSFYILVFNNLLKDYSAIYKAFHYQIQEFFKHSIIIPFEEHLVMLIKAANYTIAQIESNIDFINFLNTMGIKCGISLKFNDFLDLKYYFRQAIAAIREGENKKQPGPCFFYKDFFLEDLASSLKEVASLKSFCNPQIAILKKHDEESNSEFVKTLYQYFLHGRNMTDAAYSLFIHRNTLSYRLLKIKELIDIDLDDNQQLFHFLISCRLVEFI